MSFDKIYGISVSLHDIIADNIKEIKSAPGGDRTHDRWLIRPTL